MSKKYKHYLSVKKYHYGDELSTNEIGSEDLLVNSYLADESFVLSQLSVILGDVLTIVDAAFIDVIQRKAIKDLIRKSISARMETICEMMTNQEEIQKVANESFNNLSEEEQKEVLNNPISVDEALGLEKPEK